MSDGAADRSTQPGSTAPTAPPAARSTVLAVLGDVTGRRARVEGDADGLLRAALTAGGARLVTHDGAPDAAPDDPYDLLILAADAPLLAGDAGHAPGSDARSDLAALLDRLAPGGMLLMEAPNPWGLRHLVIPGELLANPAALQGDGGPTTWGRRRLSEALAGAGFPAQRWWSALPGLDRPAVLIGDELWDAPGATDRIRFLVREPIAPPPAGRHVDVDPVDAFGSILDQGLARDLADAHVVIAARAAASLPAMAARLVLAPDPAVGPAWSCRMDLAGDDWTLLPADGATEVRDGPLRWRPAPIPLPAVRNGEDVLIAALLEHGWFHASTVALLEAWWAGAEAAMDGPDGRAIRIDPGRFGVLPDGTWTLVLPSPTSAFPMPIHLAAYGALVQMLTRRLPTAGMPRGASLQATIGEVAADMMKAFDLELGVPGATLWSVLEAGYLARMLPGRPSVADVVQMVRDQRDATLGDLLDGMPVSAHKRTARMAVDAEARVTQVADELHERERELRRVVREHAGEQERSGAAATRIAELEAQLAVAEERIATLVPREAEVEALKAALKDNGRQIRELRAEVGAAREQERRVRAEALRLQPVEMPLRPPGRVHRLRERLRERRTRALVLRSGWFDVDWYVARYPDVGRSGQDAVVHYLRHGWLEGRDPGPRFSSRLYRRRYPDVAAAGIDPLVHHVRHGAREGREVPRASAIFTEPRTAPAGAPLPSATAGSDAGREARP